MIARSFLVMLVLLSTAGYGAASAAKDVPPFAYTFQVTSVKLTATFTKGAATATTNLRLRNRPRRKTLAWYGKENRDPGWGYAATLLPLAGTLTYAGLDQAACNGAVNVDSSRWNPIYARLVLTNARDRVVTRPTIHVSVGRFPISTTYPRRDGSCARWWLWEDASSVRPYRVVHRAGFSITVHDKETLAEQGGTFQWTLRMTVRRVRYRRIDCAHTPNC